MFPSSTGMQSIVSWTHQDKQLLALRLRYGAIKPLLNKRAQQEDIITYIFAIFQLFSDFPAFPLFLLKLIMHIQTGG